MNAATELSREIGKKRACESLGVPRATYYRYISPKPTKDVTRLTPPLALTESE